MSVNHHRPEGFHAVPPYLIVAGVDRLIRFLTEAFGAEVRERATRPDGSVMHAQVRIEDAVVEMGEGQGEWQPMSAALHLYVADADATYRRALEAGGDSLYEPTDRPYGDREAGVRDPSGNLWFIATHREAALPGGVELGVRGLAGRPSPERSRRAP